MSEEVHQCQKCQGFGSGMEVGIDPITELKLCPKCLQEVTFDRVLGKDWGEKTVMTTDPNINVPLPVETLEEALGEDVVKKHGLEGKTIEDVVNPVKRLDDLENKVNSLDAKLDKILEKL